MANVVLHYFDGRGRAEIIRLMLAAGNIEYESVQYKKRQQFLKALDDGILQFKALPMLEIDSMNVVQTNAIVRHLARRNDMNGDTPEEMTQADTYFEGSRDLYMPFLGIGFRGTQMEIASQAADTVLPKFLPVFNDILAKSTSGYMVGSKLTFADIGLLEALLAFEDFYEEDKLADFIHVKKFLVKMKSEAWFSRYMKEVRKKPNDETYIKTVMTVLGRSEIIV